MAAASKANTNENLSHARVLAWADAINACGALDELKRLILDGRAD